MSLHRVILPDQRLRLTRVLYEHFSDASSGQRAKRIFLHRLSTATIYAFDKVSNVANSYLAYWRPSTSLHRVILLEQRLRLTRVLYGNYRL
jgi:hypothetical protein